MLICDKCSASIVEGAKFCPQCGDPVTEADRVTVPADKSQVANVEFFFGYSSSPNYSKAVEICKNIPTYSENGEGKNTEHYVLLPISEIELLINLYELVGSWKSSKMLINGQPQTKQALVYKGAGCFRARQKSYSPKQYCFGESEYEYNIWGCRKLGMPISEWGGGWLEYGKLDKQGIWHFDKKKIQHEIDIAIHEHELCPVLNREQILETLAKMPDTINPKTDKNWAYRTTYEEINGDYRDVAVGIKPIIKKMNRYVLGSYKPKWETENSSEATTKKTYEIKIEPKIQSKSKLSSKKQNSSALGFIALIIVIFILYLILK